MAPIDTTGRDAALILALASGLRQHEAARQCRVSRSTIARRLREPGFRAAISEARDRMVSEACGRLVAQATRAADVLADLLVSEDDGIRLRAARGVIELGLRIRDATELDARMSEIERMLDGGSGWPRAV